MKKEAFCLAIDLIRALAQDNRTDDCEAKDAEIARLRALLAEENGWKIEYERIEKELKDARAEINRLSIMIGQMGDRPVPPDFMDNINHLRKLADIEHRAKCATEDQMKDLMRFIRHAARSKNPKGVLKRFLEEEK